MYLLLIYVFIFEQDGKTDVVANDLGDRVTPCVVAFTDHDKVSYGIIFDIKIQMFLLEQNTRYIQAYHKNQNIINSVWYIEKNNHCGKMLARKKVIKHLNQPIIHENPR